MSRLNETVKKTPVSPMQAEAKPSGKTHEGAPGFARTPETELFMKATTTFAGVA